ncbi:TIM23 complex component [Sporothrix stenoceras]|uniref:Presequence translocated-associated motor subunit PAM17 n=1 Tax=Sporothrix stenoceras TaxID=5173 RepID=A0ABR3Z6U9_9PEZI
MLTTTAPTLLRPGLAVASRTKPAVTTATKTSAAFILRRPTTISMAMPKMQSRMFAAPAGSLKRKITPTTPSTFRRCASSTPNSTKTNTSSSTTLHSRPPATGATRNRDAAVDAAAAARIAERAQADARVNAATSNGPSTKDLPPLDWNTFFALRKTRRRIQVAFSVTGGLTGGLVGGLFLGSGVAEPILSTIPLDPFLTLGLMTFGFAALGWLAGPSIGNVVFYAWKRQYKTQMTLKETQFFARIKRNRVDPTASSAGNPVPDFYGEKISSVAGYRQWLKDQRAFNKKRTTFV